MPGFRADVPALMRACDVVLHTSTDPEPFGRVVVEGMLAGRPVVATDRGGPAEILAGSGAGLLVPAGDADALADALGGLLGNPERAVAMGRAGRERARRDFSVEQMVGGLDRVLASVARPSSPSSPPEASPSFSTPSSLVP
jgi:glycosyltransferase involved in cell wall biosynthesis